MRKRLFASVAVAFALSLVAAGCSDDGSNDAAPGGNDDAALAIPVFPAGSTMDTLQKAGKVRVGVKYDQGGFGLKDPTTGKLVGFDIEIAKLIAQGIYGGTAADAESKIEFSETVSKNRESFIQEGKVDLVVATYTINDTRKQVVSFAGPYYVAHGDLMVKSSENGIKTVTDLNGKTACIVRGSTYEQSIKTQAPQATVLPLDTYSQCAIALEDNRVQAVATDNGILAGLAAKSNGAFKLANTSYTDEPYGIGLKKDDVALKGFVNSRLQTIYDNGAWKGAFERTLGTLSLPLPAPPAIDTGSAAASTTTAAPTTTAKP